MILSLTLALFGFASVAATVESYNETLTATSFNLNEANKHLWLSAAAYCGASKMKSHTFKGPTSGFVVTYTFDDLKDTQGYVGYLPSDSSIYVVFRGSSSIQNWITNLQVTKTAYKGSCCGQSCQIHKGFSEAAASSFNGILNAVKSLRSKYPSYAVKCTGHSLGAALSQITAMTLKDNGITPAVLYNFGQPRIGDASYSSCSSSYVPTERVVHLKDTVPHIPYESWGYKHECREAYESSSSSNPQVKDCSASNCEDSTCSNQWAFKDTNVDDHMLYLGLSVTCAAVS
jgi:predicted lipase